MKRRLLFIGVLAGGAALITPLHAGAVAAFVATLGNGANGNDHYAGVCNGQIGTATNLNQVTFVVDATGTATSTSPGVIGVGTTVTCVIKDSVTGATYGTISGGLPGSTAVAEGLVSVPFNSSPEACFSGVGVFSDGSSVTANPTC